MEGMKKLVVKISTLHDDKDKQKAMKTVSALQGIDIIAIDMKGKKLTLIGTMDPVEVVSKLRKHWQTDIVSVGPAKDPEKKEEPKPEDAAKKEEGAKEETNKKEGGEQQKSEQEAKKEGEPNKEEPKKEEPKKEEEAKIRAEPVNLELVRAYRPYYNPYMANYYYAHQSMEENPNACVIC